MLSMCRVWDTSEELEITVPEDTWPEFTVYVERDPDVSIGLTVDSADGKLLHVCSILDGPVDDYNNSIELEEPEINVHPIQAGDYIWAVNGIDGQVRDMLEELRYEPELHLSVVRPRLWTVTVERDGPGDPFGPSVVNLGEANRGLRQSLGIDVNWHAIGSSLLIRNVVDDGLISDWNLRNPGYEVQANDRIVEVNGVVAAGNVAPLIDQLMLDQPVLQLIMSRPADRGALPPPYYQQPASGALEEKGYRPVVGYSRNGNFDLGPDPDEDTYGGYSQDAGMRRSSSRVSQIGMNRGKMGIGGMSRGVSGESGEGDLPVCRSTLWLGSCD